MLIILISQAIFNNFHLLKMVRNKSTNRLKTVLIMINKKLDFIVIKREKNKIIKFIIIKLVSIVDLLIFPLNTIYSKIRKINKINIFKMNSK